jgi:K+/H+ antiporter YhaU regulatory subunit KhtT
MAFGRFVLPSKKECNNTNNISCFISNKLHSSYKAKVGEVFELSIPNNFEEKSLEKLELISRYQCSIISIFRDKKFILTPLRSEKLK